MQQISLEDDAGVRRAAETHSYVLQADELHQRSPVGHTRRSEPVHQQLLAASLC